MDKWDRYNPKDFEILLNNVSESFSDADNRFVFDINNQEIIDYIMDSFSQDLSPFRLGMPNQWVSDVVDELLIDYQEEIRRIENALIVDGYPVSINDWGVVSVKNRMDAQKSKNLRQMANHLWRTFSNPIRIKNNHLYLLVAPSDILSAPGIYAIPFNLFVNSALSYRSKVFRSKRTLHILSTIVLFLLLVLVVVILRSS